MCVTNPCVLSRHAPKKLRPHIHTLSLQTRMCAGMSSRTPTPPPCPRQPIERTQTRPPPHPPPPPRPRPASVPLYRILMCSAARRICCTPLLLPLLLLHATAAACRCCCTPLQLHAASAQMGRGKIQWGAFTSIFSNLGTHDPLVLLEPAGRQCRWQ